MSATTQPSRFAPPASVVTNLPGGVMITTGAKKEFFASGVINSNSECSINLTSENTATGTALFSQILFATSVATIAAATATDVVFSSLKAISTGNKTVTFRYAKGNSQTIVLGGTAVGVTNAVAGTVVQFYIVGL